MCDLLPEGVTPLKQLGAGITEVVHKVLKAMQRQWAMRLVLLCHFATWLSIIPTYAKHANLCFVPARPVSLHMLKADPQLCMVATSSASYCTYFGGGGIRLAFISVDT